MNLLRSKPIVNGTAVSGAGFFAIQTSDEETSLAYLTAIVLNCAVRPNTAFLFIA